MLLGNFAPHYGEAIKRLGDGFIKLNDGPTEATADHPEDVIEAVDSHIAKA